MANGYVNEHVEEALLEQPSDGVVMQPASERFWNDHNVLCIVAKFVSSSPYMYTWALLQSSHPAVRQTYLEDK